MMNSQDVEGGGKVRAACLWLQLQLLAVSAAWLSTKLQPSFSDVEKQL